MVKKVRLTPFAVESLSAGTCKDSLTPGLYVELVGADRRVFKYRRRISGTSKFVRMSFGPFPARSIAEAREWARELNLMVEVGIDPRERAEEAKRLATMTVDRAHALYMEAVREGRGSRAKRRNKPRTIHDKLELYKRDIAPKLGTRSIYDVTEEELVNLVIRKGKTAKIRANRLAAELRVFFGWAASLRGTEVGLKVDPSRRLGDLRFPESPRERKLSLAEIELFLIAIAEEERDVRRAMLLWLLTAARLAEVVCAHRDEFVGDEWTIPAARSKNAHAHVIRLGPWGCALMECEGEWVFPAQRVAGPRRYGWYKARDSVLNRMSQIAGRPIERFTPHDFRRTARSNTKRLKFDFETAEAMMNHLKSGLERIYDGYELEEEKAAWFRTWENEIVGIARKAGVAEALEVPAHAGEPEPVRLAPGMDGLWPAPRAIGHAMGTLMAGGIAQNGQERAMWRSTPRHARRGR